MSNNKNTNNATVTPEGAEMHYGEEKKSMKDRAVEKAETFKENHPTAAKVLKTSVKVVKNAALIGLGIFVGSKIGSRQSGGSDLIDMSECSGDEYVSSEVVDATNDNNN